MAVDNQVPHEPECQPHGYYTCTCDELRGAYQRGRQDAANAIVAQVVKWLESGLYGTPAFRVVWLDYANKLLVAARGDVEQ
jgi:elongation factor P hydroxylase